MPARGPARLAGAMAASLALHGVALVSFTQLPRGWQAGEWSLSHAGTGSLRAKLRASPAGAESKQPDAFAQPPETPPAHEAPDAERIRELPPTAPAAVAARGLDGDDPRSPQIETEQGRSQAPSTGVLAAPVYYTANQLDQRPQIKLHIEPVFPPGAAVSSGRVVLRLYISEQGEVEKMVVVSAEPPGLFEKSALDAFAAARYTPGMKNGGPVPSLIALEVLFGAPVPGSAGPRLSLE